MESECKNSFYLNINCDSISIFYISNIKIKPQKDEVLKLEDRFNLNQNLIYNDYDYPRNIIYDFSENIRPYYVQNENVDEDKLEEVEEDILNTM